MKNFYCQKFPLPFMKGGLRITLAGLIAFVFTHSAFAQIVISQTTSAQSLAQLLSGTGVTISNYSRTCDQNGTATFTSSGTNLGITEGIVLASGRVQNIPQAANNFASTQFSNTADPQLSTLTSGNIYDKCILEFDITPQGSTLSFDYVFASEEYPEFVCSPYNDVFGFFITGPNPLGGNYTNKNLATLPNSTMPVCINTVNPGASGTYQGTTWNSNNCQSLSNTSSYVNNLSPVNANIVYDGMTVVLTATAAVVPCQTYHLKIAVADVGDRIYDSGVFLQAYSFTSTPYTVSVSSNYNYIGYTSAYEGCVNGSFTVSISNAQSSPVVINLVTTGTATSGTDYSPIPTSVTIPAGQTSVTIPMTTILDAVTESPETVTVTISNSCAGTLGSTASLTISDNPLPAITVGDTTLCLGQSSQLTATGATTYQWSPTAGLNNPNIANPIATPATTTTYTVSMTLGSCVKTLGASTIVVSNPAVATISTPKDTICNGGTIQLNGSTSGGIAPYTYVWSTGSTASNITVSSSGTYSTTITDKFGCTANTSKSVIVSNLGVSGTTTPVSCFGNTNGSVSITPTGLNSPFTYQWSDGPTTQNRANLGGGTYTVTVRNTAGCSVTASYTVVQPSAALAATATAAPTTCNGNSTGTIGLTVTGGVAPYRYLWNTGDTTKDRSNLAAGIYTVTITDAGLCTITRSATVTQPTGVSITESHTDASCFGSSNGTITTITTGGTGAYTYNWTSGQTTANISAVPAGTYTLTATDANNCTATRSATITQPTAVNALPVPTNPACTGGSNGAVNLTVSGGTAGYTYIWNNGATTQNITGLGVGIYTATITDTQGCKDTATTTLSQSGSMVSSATKTDVSCFGGNNGTITISVTGGNSPYNYNWGGGVTSQNRSSLTAGNYTVTVTDALSCTVTASATVAQPAQALNTAGTPAAAACFGGSTGSITTATSGGTSPYTYNWGGGITTPNRSNLAAGTYTVTTTDANLCTTTTPVTVAQPASALAGAASVTHVGCFGGNTGAITISPSGGTGPYSYNWGNSITSQNRANLTAGTYTVTITDDNLCTATVTATVNQSGTALSGSAVPTDAACFGGNNGSIALSVTGGTSPYTYNWGGGITTQNRTNLLPGNYTVTITDNNLCTTTTSATVGQPANGVSATPVVSHVKCFGAHTGEITLTPAGGTAPYTYNWGGGITSQNRSNIPAGNYAVTITDSRLCSATASATVNQPALALAVLPAATAVACYGGNNGSVSTTVTGGTAPYTYNWGNNITTHNITGLTAGTYQVIVTDANLCTAVASAVVSQPAAALTCSQSVTHVSCFGGSNGVVQLTASGGTVPHSYDWGNNLKTNLRNNLSAGNYTVTVNDSKGCATIASVTVQQPTSLAISKAPKNVSCFGGTDGGINVTITGGIIPYSYKWNNNIISEDLSNIPAGTYSLVVVDSHNCSVTTSISITQPSQLQATGTATDVRCFGENTGSVTANISGGTTSYSYKWSNNASSKDITNIPAGTYTLTVTDANLCTAIITRSITEPVAIAITENHTEVPCYAGATASINTSASGGTGSLSYKWNNNSTAANLANLPAGTYNLTVTDANACTAVKSIVITQPPVIKISETHKDLSCNSSNNGSIDLTVSGGSPGYRYKWNNGDTLADIAGLEAGTYAVTITDNKGCHATLSTIILSQPDVMVATITPANLKCFGTNTGKADAEVTGGTKPYRYMWSNNFSTEDLNNVNGGDYQLTVTDAQGCSVSATTTIGTAPALQVYAEPDTVECTTATGNIGFWASEGTGPYTYKWNNGTSQQHLYDVLPGTYTVTVYDANGCTVSGSYKILSRNSFTVSASGGGTIKLGDTVALYATSTGSEKTTYAWTPSYNLTCADCQNTIAQPGETTIYTVVATDTNGCTAQDTVSVEVIDDHTLFTPNAFTPNGDGNNDYFSIFGNMDAISKLNVMIFDRWGEKVFESDEKNFQWDGTFKGERLNPGVFVFVLKLGYLDGEDKMKKGSITLLR